MELSSIPNYICSSELKVFKFIITIIIIIAVLSSPAQR